MSEGILVRFTRAKKKYKSGNYERGICIACDVSTNNKMGNVPMCFKCRTEIKDAKRAINSSDALTKKAFDKLLQESE